MKCDLPPVEHCPHDRLHHTPLSLLLVGQSEVSCVDMCGCEGVCGVRVSICEREECVGMCRCEGVCRCDGECRHV